MRILYLHQYFTTPDMEGGIRSYEFGRRLVGAGHDVQIVTADLRRESGPRTTTEAGMTVHWLPVSYSNHMPFRRRILAFLSYAVRASVLANKLGGDLVLATSTPLTIAIPGLIASKRLSAPLVFEVRDLWPHVPIAVGAIDGRLAKWATRALERAAYRGASRIISLAPDNVGAIEQAGSAAGRVVTIPNAADREMFAPTDGADLVVRSRYEWLGSRPLVVYTGALGLVNDLPYLVRVAAEVLDLDGEVRFLIVGDGIDIENVRRLSADLGVLNRNVFMLPPVPKAEVPAFLHAANIAASVFIDNEALWAVSPNKLFDALASETPVAINHGGWLAELLTDSGAGLVLPAGQYRKAAELLVRHINDRSWLSSASEMAGKLARERFDRDILFEQFHATLRDAYDEYHRDI